MPVRKRLAYRVEPDFRQTRAGCDFSKRVDQFDTLFIRTALPFNDTVNFLYRFHGLGRTGIVLTRSPDRTRLVMPETVFTTFLKHVVAARHLAAAFGLFVLQALNCAIHIPADVLGIASRQLRPRSILAIQDRKPIRTAMRHIAA